MSSEHLVESLKELSKALGDHSHNGPYHQLFGWQGVPLDKADLMFMAQLLWEKVESVDWSETAEDMDEHLAELAQKVRWVTGNVPQLSSGHMTATGIADTLLSIDMQLNGLADERSLRGTLALPARLHKLSITAQRRINSLHQELPDLEKKVRAITDAHEASEKLDITLADLNEALKEIARSKDNAASFAATAQSHRDELLQQIKELKEHQVWAGGIRRQVGETYVASTNAGLASSFSTKAKALSDSIRIWLGALGVALLSAAVIGHLRFPVMLAAIGTKPDWGVVIANVVLSTLSLSPSIWLGWVATKQIGQRFRLSEDYAYKAALSMAYEGYRAEASKIDPELQARLFSSALSRLDELPLRLVEKEVHPTPATELFKSEMLGKSAEELKAIREWITERIDRVIKSRKDDAAD